MMVRAAIKNVALRFADGVARLMTSSNRSVTRVEAVYIVLLRPLGLGDLMMLSPFLNAVARHYGDTPVYLVTEYRPFLSLERVEWIHPTRVARKDFKNSLVISPTLSWRHLKYMLKARYYLGYFLSNRLIGNVAVPHYRYSPEKEHYFQRAKEILDCLDISDGELQYGKLLVDDSKIKDLPTPYICIAPYCNWPERQYPKKQFVEVIQSLVGDVPVVLVGGNGDEEKELARQIVAEIGSDKLVNRVGETSFSQAEAIVKNAMLYIGNDSGLTHAAFLSGVPTIAICGCVPGELRMPLDPILQERIAILGAADQCPYYPCYDGYNRPSCCNAERYACLARVAPEEVSRLASEMAVLSPENRG